MAKPRIRITQKDEAEFKRLRNNYQSKLGRISKDTGFSKEFLMEEIGISVPTLKEFRNRKAFKTRDSFNEWKDTLNIVNSRNYKPLKIKTNSKGLRYPAVVNEIGKKTTKQAINRVNEKKAEYAELPLVIEGAEDLKVSDQQLMLRESESYGLYTPEEFDIERFAYPKSVESNIRRNEERSSGEYYDERMTRFKDNFISMFEHEDSDEETIDIIKRLRNIPPEDFYELYLMIPAIDFEDWDSEDGGYISGTKNASDVFGYYLELYERGKIDTSLKGI